MKRATLMALLLAVACLVAAPASGAVYTYMPSPDELWELEHQWAYEWGFEWTHTDETITNVVLTYDNIWDWRVEIDNLYTHILDDPTIGTNRYWDNEGGGDYFAGNTLVGTWHDPAGGSPTGFDLVYDFADLGLVDDFALAALDGTVGFGIDADCHYYNDGITLKVYTECSTVPEPGTMALLGIGLLGAGVTRRWKKR